MKSEFRTDYIVDGDEGGKSMFAEEKSVRAGRPMVRPNGRGRV